ncbi:MAG: nucleotidyl transferase AbiEii/AbiGii toxin family protein [Pyrinomonadaceae bacterium]
MFDLYEEFRKLMEALDEHKIDYALCGGLALAVYDRPRATVDIDLLIISESLDQVLEIAKTLDYTIRGLDMTFAKGGIEIRRVSKIHSQTGQVLSLDLLLVTPEIRQVWDSRVAADWEGGRFFVVSREGLISLKMMRGSPQDLADIVALKEDIDDATN